MNTLHMWSQIVGKVRLALSPEVESLVGGPALRQRGWAHYVADSLRDAESLKSSSTSSITS